MAQVWQLWLTSNFLGGPVESWYYWDNTRNRTLAVRINNQNTRRVYVEIMPHDGSFTHRVEQEPMSSIDHQVPREYQSYAPWDFQWTLGEIW